jgi:beta-1,4-N-acetylglucosaminyltransferase
MGSTRHVHTEDRRRGIEQFQQSKVVAPVELLLVCSSGGHLLQLASLSAAWSGFDRAWISFDKSDVRSLLADERVFFAHGPTNRSVKNLFLNLILAWRIVGRLRPRVVLTTGAGVAVPFAWIARVRGARVVYVESLTRIHKPSLSCRLLAPIADRIYAQWPELSRTFPKARYVGGIFSA